MGHQHSPLHIEKCIPWREKIVCVTLLLLFVCLLLSSHMGSHPPSSEDLSTLLEDRACCYATSLSIPRLKIVPKQLCVSKHGA